MAISRTTPTGALLTLGDPETPSAPFEVPATLVADRIFDLTAKPASQFAVVSYDQLKHAVALMLAEGSVHVEVQWT